MKTTTHKLLALTVLFIFFACSSTKKVTETETKQSVKSETEVSKALDVKTELQVTDKSEKFTDKEIQTVEKLTDLWEKNVTEYDTEKPIVPGTNKPPVKSETIYTNTKQHDKKDVLKEHIKLKNDIVIDSTAILKSRNDSLQKVKDKLAHDTLLEETSSDKSLLGWIVLVLFVGIIIFVIWKFK